MIAIDVNAVFGAKVRSVTIVTFSSVAYKIHTLPVAHISSSLSTTSPLRLHSSQKMPKEAREPIFCCGAHHKSANYHRRTVHQQHTKIYFKGNPLASFILRRNPATSLFHCPHCNRSWAMATPIRHHIFQRCEGYAQFRSPTAAKNAGGDDASSEDDIPLSSALDANTLSETKAEDATNAAEQMGADYQDDSADQQSRTPGGTPKTPATRSERAEADVVHVVDSPEDSPTLDKGSGFAPTLRPAVWSPVDSRTSASSSTRTLVDAGIPTLSFAGRQPLSSAPRRTRNASRSSNSAALTVADDVFTDSRSARVKADPDDATTISRTVSRCIPSQAGTLASPCSIHNLPKEPTAIQCFLEGLRRPLGHATPLFHKMGLVTEEDLELICTMPETWNEVGAVLQAGGVTTIEWLMVKEAFKSKAKEAGIQDADV
ncbi:hypothetical protein ONZ51_g924 [Trametes cubensis]|uniref:Uncharacterized protein n=1 Tax=Trametes cubensis TaxID=1111947 RepID=A0AAD7XGA1_9APHY|nr:hypothetical protein ONZ51_g924 [Trametes cubensis]